MSTLLAINSSVNPQASHTRDLLNDYVQQWRQRHPEGRVVERDLAVDAPKHLDGQTLAAFCTPADALDEAGRTALAQSDEYIEELKAADEVVIGAPMYNFSIPSNLKAWIDQVCRAGVTFRYTPEGPQGLLSGKKARVITARGGHYGAESPVAHLNFHDTYLKAVLGFIGITEVTTINAEGVASGNHGVDAARQQLAELA